MVINLFNNIHQIWKVDVTTTLGFLILLGIKRYKYGKHFLNLGIEVSVFRGSQEPQKVESKPNLDNFFSLKKLTDIKEKFYIFLD